MIRARAYMTAVGLMVGAIWSHGQDSSAVSLRNELSSLIDSAVFQGLDSVRYKPGDAFAFLRSLRSGEGIYEQVSYDGISTLYDQEEDRILAEDISRVRTAAQLRQLAMQFLPGTTAYDTLKEGLIRALAADDKDKIRQLAPALNFYRWIHHHSFPRCIVVNIASATLCYFERDTLRLRMKVVAGKPSTRTPRFAAWCDKVILYPYWNIPRKIAVNEFLPMLKRLPALAETMNIQLLDSRGRIIDPTSVDWGRWNRDNFPYAMRQSTGCDNALGVIKFNLTSPYDVYMHDTNLKAAFRSTSRYFSHGCIRLEKPFELGAALLGDKLDTTFLAAGLKDQQPRPLYLEKPVPVFVVYLTADIDADGKLSFYRDIYHLLK